MTAADILAFNELKRIVERQHALRKLAPPPPPMPAATHVPVVPIPHEHRPTHCRVVANDQPVHEMSWQHACAVLDQREQRYSPFARAWRDGGLR